MGDSSQQVSKQFYSLSYFSWPSFHILLSILIHQYVNFRAALHIHVHVHGLHQRPMKVHSCMYNCFHYTRGSDELSFLTPKMVLHLCLCVDVSMCGYNFVLCILYMCVCVDVCLFTTYVHVAWSVTGCSVKCSKDRKHFYRR